MDGKLNEIVLELAEIEGEFKQIYQVIKEDVEYFPRNLEEWLSALKTKPGLIGHVSVLHLKKISLVRRKNKLERVYLKT